MHWFVVIYIDTRYHILYANQQRTYQIKLDLQISFLVEQKKNEIQ